MKTSADFYSSSLQTTVGELIDARVPFVKNAIYEYSEECGVTHCTPVRTFNGWACDCIMLVEKNGRFTQHADFPHPLPVLQSDLGEPVAAIV